VQADIGKAFDAFVMPKIEPTAALPTALPTFPAAAKPPDTPPVPTSSNEFVRVWRRQCKTNAQKYAYLVQTAPNAVFDVDEATGTASGRVTILEQFKKTKTGLGSLVGVYHDRYVRREGGWLFAERRIEVIDQS
jgi:hypothetical protein